VENSEFLRDKEKKEIHSDSAALGNVIKYVGAKEKVSSTVAYVYLLSIMDQKA